MGIQIGAATVESSIKLSQKLTKELPYDSVISLLGIYPKIWNTSLKEYMHPYVHWNITYNSEDMNAAQVPISRCMDKKAVVHLHNIIALSHTHTYTYTQRKGNLTFCNSMGGPGECYAKWNKLIRERQVLIHLDVESNEQNKSTKK